MCVAIQYVERRSKKEGDRGEIVTISCKKSLSKHKKKMKFTCTLIEEVCLFLALIFFGYVHSEQPTQKIRAR